MEMLLKIVIVDDEPLAREILDSYLKKMSGVGQVRFFRNALEALRGLKTEAPDLLLLDIEMPEMSGIEFLRHLPDAPLTIFTTAYRNYAFEGYELGVIDFLLKPISFRRFEAAIAKARELLALKELSQLENGVENHSDYIFVKSGIQRIKLEFSKVTHIQGLKDYSVVYTLDKKILLKGSIKTMSEIFPAGRFLRVHKSFIVNLHYVRHLERNIILLNEYRVPIGRNFRDDLEKYMKTS